LTVLQRATQPEHGDVANRAVALLDHLVSTRTRDLATDMVAVMIGTSGALAGSLDRQMKTLDEETLVALHEALPWRSLSLMELSLRVAERRAEIARAKAARLEQEAARESRDAVLGDLAEQLYTLGVRLGNLGRKEEAAAASQETVDIFRRLAATNPDDFLPGLGWADPQGGWWT
jgi:uncharacterized small protein (DUF1192 family)